LAIDDGEELIVRISKREAGIAAAVLCMAGLGAGLSARQAPAPQSRAGSKTANLQVTADVVPNCVMIRKLDVLFGD